MTNTRARFQATEDKGRYYVKDMSDGSIWTRGYLRMGWAVRAAVKLNDLVTAR